VFRGRNLGAKRALIARGTSIYSFLLPGEVAAFQRRRIKIRARYEDINAPITDVKARRREFARLLSSARIISAKINEDNLVNDDKYTFSMPR